jgi:hypothetical protein
MTHAQAIDTHAAERYLLDEMRELERFAFEAHFFDCAECAEDVRTGALMREGVAAGLMPAAATGSTVSAAPAAPMASLASSGWRSGLPWAVAAMLALAVGYQSLWVVPGLRDQGVGTQALTPVTLRSASRGAETTLARPDAGVITFALDVNGVPADARLAYDLRTADGSSVASGTAVAPSPGTPLLLLVPGSAMRAAGSYVLTVRASGDAASTPVEYRFTLTEQ